MSMTRERRLELYTRLLAYRTVNGIYRLTPRQRSRVRHKENRQQCREGSAGFDHGGWYGPGKERSAP